MMRARLALLVMLPVLGAIGLPTQPLERPGNPSINVNILIEGQSNAGLFILYGGADRLKERIRRLLGFRATDTITLLGGGGTTIWSGVPLIHAASGRLAWLSPGSRHSWRDEALERAFVSYLSGLPDATRRSPTVTIWLHNETDITNPAFAAAAWESAVRHNIEEERAALGQAAATTPVDFVYVPADCPTRCVEVSGASRRVQLLKTGYEHLSSEAAFNVHIGAQIGDVDMNGMSGVDGGLHMGPDDAALLADRLSYAVAKQLAPFARPASAESRAVGSLPSTGPRAIAAGQLDKRRITVSVGLERNADGLKALSVAAARGAGWALVDGDRLVYGDGAVLAGTRIIVHFPADIRASSTARLHYGWGSGRILVEQAPRPGTGRYAAVYDSNGLPLWMDAKGLPLAEVPAPPGRRFCPSVIIPCRRIEGGRP